MSRESKWWKAVRPKWWRGDAPKPAAPLVLKGREPRTVTAGALQELVTTFRGRKLVPVEPSPFVNDPFQPAKPPKGVDNVQMAMDWSGGDGESLAEISNRFGGLSDGVGWLGFAYLAQLMQRPEYRTLVGTRSQEMTREWIELTYEGKDDKTIADKNVKKKLKELNDQVTAFRIRDLFREVTDHDGAFGRGHIYVDTGASRSDAELRTELKVDTVKLGKNKIKGFRTVEPIWCYPLSYNSDRPLEPDFYKPQTWNVNGKSVHKSRLITFISREVPDLLKPAYSFGGVALTQLAKPYVDNWLRTRQSVSDIIHSFTVFVLKTVMSAQLDLNAAQDLNNQADAFNTVRDNKGLFILDKESEEFENISAPLSGLEGLQAQSQEQMASVSRTPLVKLLGVTPSGLNASSDGEIRTYYDTILSEQEHLYREHLTTILAMIQIHLWGKVDDGIGFKFVPLWQLDEAGEASVRKTDADTDAVLINVGVISQEESRSRLASERNGPYGGLDAEDVPEPETDVDENGDPVSTSGDPAKSSEPREALRSGV